MDLLRVKFNNIDDIHETLENHNDVSAILLEPVQGEGGIIPCENSYLQALRELCDEKKILLMIDEVQSGFCRTGKWFSYQHSNIQPDVVMVAKALGNGVPIGACLARDRLLMFLKLECMALHSVEIFIYISGSKSHGHNERYEIMSTCH